MNKPWQSLAWFFAIVLSAILLLASCTTGQSPTQVDHLANAEAEATVIIQRAQATALALQAQAEATALVSQARREATSIAAQALPAGPVLAITLPVALPSDDEPEDESAGEAPAITNTLESGAETETVRILRVTLAEETNYIYIQYVAPPEMAQRWNQTSVYVEDMETGTRYSEVPFMPLIGPLFNRPVNPGQSGFFMIINLPTPLNFGDRIRIKLGNYIFEDLVIER